ncbi:MAG: hypothetical protein ACP5MD_05205 [Verrucomicrobiia bacterium]
MKSRDVTAVYAAALLAALVGLDLTVWCAASGAAVSTNAPPAPAMDGEQQGDVASSEPAQEQSDAEQGTDANTAKPAESLYQSIIARNAFGLRPPPPPTPPPDPTPQVTPSALKLTGITTLYGGKRAMFVLQEPNKPQLISDLVREGEKDTVITNLEVLSIDERAGVVRVVYGGKELSLNFQDNGLKAPVAPVQGRPGVPQPGVAVAGVQPGASGGAATTGARPGMQPTVQPATGAFPSTASQNPSGMRSIPTRPTRLPASGGAFVTPNLAGAQDVQATQPGISPEQQIRNMRAQQELLRRYGIPAPPLPPVPGEPTVSQPGDVMIPQPVPVPPAPGM